MNRLRATTLAAFTLAGWSGPIAGAETAAAPKPTEVYEMRIQGSVIGTEEVVRVPAAGKTTLTSTVTVTPPGGGDGKLVQAATFGPDGLPLSYELSIDAQGQQLVFKVTPTDTGFTMTIAPRGAAEPAKSESVQAKAPVYLVDNNFASHLDLLTRALTSLGPDQEKAFTVLVPQALQAFRATARRGPDGSVRLAGVAVPTRSYALTIANVREDLVARASDGALLEASVAIQNFVLRRKGLEIEPAPAADAGGDPREATTTVASEAGPLPAIVLVPESERPVPGVVFLSGSGAHDADETIGPNKPFRDIARGLGDRGIASVRFDKRTYAVKDPAKLGTVTLKTEYYDDALAAAALLRRTPGVDPKRVFILGHSEGASVAPKVAQLDAGSRGAVLMAPAVRPLDEIVIDQARFGAKLVGRSDEEIAETVNDLQRRFSEIRDPKRLDTPPFMGAPASYWREVIALDVPAMVRAMKSPVLVVQGDKDIQVRKDLDFDVLVKKAGTGDGRVSYRSFPGLNHLFMKVERESTGAEYGAPGHVDASVTSAIADWILAH